MDQKNYTIGVLAKCAGVNVETIRFYQRRGLLKEPEKPLDGYRRYSKSDLQRIRFIKHGQSLGFSLAEIDELLSLEDRRHCAEAREIALRKLVVIRERIASLQNMEMALSGLVRRCSDNKEQITCPIILTLQKETNS